RKSGESAMTDEERREYGLLNQDMLSDEAIGRQGAAAAAAAGRSGAPPAARQRAQDRRSDLLAAAQRRRAEELVVGMARPGSDGDAARAEVMRRIRQEPGKFAPNLAQHLEEMSPRALEAFDDEAAREEEGLRAHREARGKRRQREAEQRRE